MEISGAKVNWTEGGVIIFDDSFEHWVWNNSEEERVIFILDILQLPDVIIIFKTI